MIREKQDRTPAMIFALGFSFGLPAGVGLAHLIRLVMVGAL